MQMGMGFPITGRALACGLRPGLGCDIVSLGSGDLFTQMRLALQMQRALDNDGILRGGELPDAASPAAREALELATIDGAAAMGLDSEVGSLTPGKLADLILIRTDGLNFAPERCRRGGGAPRARVRRRHGAGRRPGRQARRAAARRRRRARPALAEQSRDRIMKAAEGKGGLLLDAARGLVRRGARGGASRTSAPASCPAGQRAWPRTSRGRRRTCAPGLRSGDGPAGRRGTNRTAGS